MSKPQWVTALHITVDHFTQTLTHTHTQILKSDHFFLEEWCQEQPQGNRHGFLGNKISHCTNLEHYKY